jgi:hypothetical protein
MRWENFREFKTTGFGVTWRPEKRLILPAFGPEESPRFLRSRAADHDFVQAMGDQID